MNKINLGVALFSLALLIPITVSAATFWDEDMPAPTQDIADDLYAGGDTKNIDVEVAQDAFVAGNTVTFLQRVGGDVFSAGNSVTVAGPVGDDVFVAGNNVAIANTVAGDIFGAGASVTITEDAIVDGDVFVAGQNVIIAGVVNVDVRSAGERVEIASTARINGRLLAYGAEPVAREGSVITGGTTVRHNDTLEKREQRTHIMAVQWLRTVVASFAFGIALLYIFPHFSGHVISESKGRVGRSLLIGFLWVLALPFTFVALAVSLLGMPLAFLLLFITIAVGAISYMYASVFVGIVLMKFFRQVQKMSPAVTPTTWVHVLLGAVAYATLSLINGIGMLVQSFVLLLLCGSILASLWAHLRHNTQSK